MSTIDVNPGSWVVEDRLAEAFAVGLDPAENAILGMKNPGGRYPGLLGIMSCYRTVWESFRFVARIDI